MARGRPTGSKNKEAPVKRTGGKKTKDPNAPKRAMSAFFFWLGENRARIKKDGMGVADVAKAAGEEWRVLKDKSKWEKLADKDKQRYESDMAVYKKK
ncbi:unnamed protein product, partial [Mesorhabditis belari]|uniref:HMG box domain-containing protein n=1 Tax=Mesorhabditis belari TaxID=2138241 RepID=A0AAF3FHV9_9BILA